MSVDCGGCKCSGYTTRMISNDAQVSRKGNTCVRRATDRIRRRSGGRMDSGDDRWRPAQWRAQEVSGGSKKMGSVTAIRWARAEAQQGQREYRNHEKQRIQR